MYSHAMKICILLVVLSVVLTTVILISTDLCRFSILYGNRKPFEQGNGTQSDDPLMDTGFTSFWRLNTTREAIRAKQAQLMQSYINSSVDPCDDFYEYACGNWETMNPIPKDEGTHSTIHLLNQNIENELRKLLSEPIRNEESPSAIDKAKIFFKDCLDEESVAKRGIEPLLKYIKDLGGWPVLDENWSEKDFDWLDLAIKLSTMGNGVIITYEIRKNPNVPTNYTMFLKQTTLGMTNRDNFLKEENSKNLEAYRAMIERVLRSLDVAEENARNVSKEIVDFEVQLANATLPQEATKTTPFYEITIQNLQNAFMYIDWQRYFSGVQQADIEANQTLVIQLGATYFENLYHVLAKTENRTMANYMIWRGVLYTILSLNGNFRDAWSDFVAIVTGQVEPMPLWQVCLRQINGNMGWATSAMFAGKFFDKTSKNETINIINSLKEAFDENLLELDWLDENITSYAKLKANAMRVAAGYPDFILSEEKLNQIYQNVEIVRGKYFENCLSIASDRQRQHLRLFFKPFYRDHWYQPSTVVNALYDTGTNRILVLAGLLQPPAFHQHFPQSLNYGALGLLMGHEIIHGFDDIGRKFDVNGNYLMWWTPEAILEFEKRQNCFLEQYENFSRHDNAFTSIGTLSENLADNGGIRLAYRAYLNWKESNPESLSMERFDNMDLNEDQLFFLSLAQVFCSSVRPEAIVETKGYEEHSPSKYRVLGTLVNFEKFAEVFNCPVDSPMNPSKKCRLW